MVDVFGTVFFVVGQVEKELLGVVVGGSQEVNDLRWMKGYVLRDNGEDVLNKLLEPFRSEGLLLFVDNWVNDKVHSLSKKYIYYTVSPSYCCS